MKSSSSISNRRLNLTSKTSKRRQENVEKTISDKRIAKGSVISDAIATSDEKCVEHSSIQLYGCDDQKPEFRYSLFLS